MLLFQAAGNEEKIGVILTKQPNDIVKGAEPVSVTVITFNANSKQAADIAASEEKLAAARKEVVTAINGLDKASKAAAKKALAEFDKAAAAYLTSHMNVVATYGKTTVNPATGENLSNAMHNLSVAIGDDPATGRDLSGKLHGAASEHAQAVFLACSSVTLMASDEQSQFKRNNVLAARKEAGSEQIQYAARQPAGSTSDAKGPVAPINYAIGGTLSQDELLRVQMDYKKAMVAGAQPTKAKQPI